jgi:hypothetical protein
LPIALCFAAAWLPASPTSAHHSFAAYESTKTLTLTGTVETFEWANPHVTLQILARENRAREQADWYIETSDPGILKRFGWKRDSIKRGDRVVVVLNPMRDGSPRGRLHTVTLLDTGQVLRTKLSGS